MKAFPTSFPDLDRDGSQGSAVDPQQPLYAAYAEGWALYAERLASEIGLYMDEPWADLGRSAGRVVPRCPAGVDTGIHSKGGPGAGAQYMVETTGMPETEVVSEIERYTACRGKPVRTSGPAQDSRAARQADRSDHASI